MNRQTMEKSKHIDPSVYGNTVHDKNDVSNHWEKIDFSIIKNVVIFRWPVEKRYIPEIRPNESVI